ncbi:hypothetical protein HGRIS_008826, partial [Hohenbuehelia grisea]
VASRKRSRATSDSPTPVKRVRSEGHAKPAVRGPETERKTKATKLILAIPAAKLDGPLKIQVVSYSVLMLIMPISFLRR